MLGQSHENASSTPDLPVRQLDPDRVRNMVLLRVATASQRLTRDDVARDLLPFVSHVHSARSWKGELELHLAALADAGLVVVQTVEVAISDAGAKRAALVLGLSNLPRNWAEAQGKVLVAKALGLEGLSSRRARMLVKPDGLRAAIVERAFGLKLRGAPTPARLRVALARVVLRRAFSDSLPANVTGKSGLSAKTGRSLAGRLATPPREFPTDSRLIAALAMEHAEARKADLASLQTALLRRYLTKGSGNLEVVATGAVRGRRKSASVSRSRRKSAPRMTTPAPVSPNASLVKPTELSPAVPFERPDFAGFVASVKAVGQTVAEGWAGNRKAFISDIWQVLQETRPGWEISEVEFKGMLAEAHSRSALALVNVDLKDERLLQKMQASALVYKNMIFHYVRLDD